MIHSLARLRSLLRRLHADRGANVMILTGAALAVLVFAVGFGVDYSRAERLQTKLNAAADAAALAAVDPSMLAQSDATAQTAAQDMFDQQVNGLPGLTIVSRSAVVSDASNGSLGTVRTVVVTYKATSTNAFGGVLRLSTLPIAGSSTASASAPPSMNFYMALDVSPSMLLPISSTGITNLTAGAWWAGEPLFYGGSAQGCDFACHADNMVNWNGGVYVIDASSRMIFLNNGSNASTVPFYRVTCSGTVTDNNNAAVGSNASVINSNSNSLPTYCNNSNSNTNNQYYNPTDNANVYIKYLPTGKSNTGSNYVTVAVDYPDTWWLAENYASVNPGQSQILLRTDAEGTAAGSVIQYAYNVQQKFANVAPPPVFKMQFLTWGPLAPQAVSTSPFGTMTGVTTLNSGLAAAQQANTFPYNLGAQAPNLPEVTMPNCGLTQSNNRSWSWTSASSATCNYDTSFPTMLTTMASLMPDNHTKSDVGTTADPANVLMIITDGMNDDPSGRGELSPSVIAQCTAIKKYAKIAILYTQYAPATINYTNDTLFQSVANNNVPNVATQLQACATQNADGTYLMQTVTTDGDVSAALNTLFSMVVQTARLIK